MMTTIDNAQRYCTLINVFTVEPQKQMALFEVLKEATQQVMSKLPGYISANLHVGDDWRTVTNYAQWATVEDYQNALKDELALTHIKQAAAMAIEFSPVTYTQIWSDRLND